MSRMSTRWSANIPFFVALVSFALVERCEGARQPRRARLAEEDTPDWTYDPNSYVGPDKWGTNVDPVCNGTAQSPINLSSSNATTNTTLPTIDVATWFNGECKTYTGEVNKLTWNVGGLAKCKEDGMLKLSWNNQTYVMQHFHLHSPSEHTLDGEFFDAEVHFVFLNPDGSVGPVIGVFLNVPTWPAAGNGSKTSLWLDQFLFNGEKKTLTDPINPFDDFFPSNKTYFHYTGSYTVPMCKDGVIPWIVLANPVEMSYRQLIAYKTTLLDLPKTKISYTNNRPVQPLNNRTVQKSTE
eukprot:CAMPEP_0198230582 /NCGR_PEP_ID=MMETSP1445-20131203/114742_1 /TAXON_ID=36898 /ORGANISM="Pyramimonas sp., Strain CCMP2087" /LENGTH=295 /DNA_ID=CAMNT_0043911139 /DNA_START=261 /DNA_END=1148 /DNA_ORIENTATION=+